MTVTIRGRSLVRHACFWSPNPCVCGTYGPPSAQRCAALSNHETCNRDEATSKLVWYYFCMDDPGYSGQRLATSLMRTYLPSRRGLAASRLPLLLLCLLIVLGSTIASARSSAENSVRSSATAAAASVQAKSDPPTTPTTTPQDPAKPQHVAAPLGPPSEVVNRQALEQHAGKNACKLLLRSTPSAAQVFVDGAFVGNSPQELVVAPGKYQVEMRGQRMDSAQRLVDLLPRETREVALSLTVRYPTHVTAQ